MQTLCAERAGILNYALEGCLQRLCANGQFSTASAVTEQIAEYKHESNPVAQWLDECAECTDIPHWQAKGAYAHYRAWSEENGRNPLSMVNHGRELPRLGVQKKRGGRQRACIGTTARRCNKYCRNHGVRPDLYPTSLAALREVWAPLDLFSKRFHSKKIYIT